MRERAVARLWEGDASLWKSGAEDRRSIENALGWLTIPERQTEELPGLERLVEEMRPGTERLLVLGMGGSSLAPLVFASSFPPLPDYPAVQVLDSTHPSMVREADRRCDPETTLYLVSSKSGSTLEPNILFDYFFARAEAVLGADAGDRFLVVTDPGSPLEHEARRRRVRRIFAGDPRIGGRYSALSNFGIVPAAFLGLDMAELLRRARFMAARCREEAPGNPGLTLGAAMAALAKGGRDKLTFSVGAPVDRFGLWAEQLIAESTGKEGKGILPVEGEPLGSPELYGDDRFFVRIEGREDASGSSPLDLLERGGQPSASFAVADALDLGAEMFRWEFATAIAGAALGINPFDQPNVQEAKDRTNEILSGGNVPPEPPAASEADLRRLLESIRPGDYFAITAFIPSTRENEDALTRLRERVRDARRVATTAGFGPRFLHSTGQFHKGGPDTGVFLQITAETEGQVPVPGKPYGFGDVLAAQAAGDLTALRSRGRRAHGVSLPEDLREGLGALEDLFGRCLGASTRPATSRSKA
ncbi:MAG: glucose-6-phosphate isomerase [Thermoanaerobaculia bacterium]